MKATLRTLLLAAVGTVALSASAVAQDGFVAPEADRLLSQGLAAYERGDFATALRLWRPLAEQGRALAQFNLGRMYANGRGVPQNGAEAVRWYRLAADQGNAKAQYSLGYMYNTGEGVPLNYVQAYKWYSLSAAQGEADARAYLALIRKTMTESQVVEAQRLAAELMPSATGPVPRQSVGPETAEPKEGSGTGFYITASGHLVTNAHVVDGCSIIALANGTRLTLVDVDTSSDLALLKRAAGASTVPLALRQGRGVRLAENVLAAGFPLAGILSSGLNVTTGAVSALAGIGDDRRRIQITAPVQPGNSGGPLLDQSGNVVGVVVSKLALSVASITGDIPQNVNFAVSLGTLQAFLDANSIDYQTRASTATKSNADVAEMARAATVQVECRGSAGVAARTLPRPAEDGGGAAAEAEVFQRAYRLLTDEGDFAGAAVAFSAFLRAYPQSEQASDAQYYIAETLLYRDRFADAAAAYVKLIEDYPRSRHAPTALVKLARSHRLSGNSIQACRTLSLIPSSYPSASSVTKQLADQEHRMANCS